jgi:hypothetical protein
MHVEMRSIGSIQPYDQNPRVNEAGVDAVAASLGPTCPEEDWRSVPGYEGLYEVSSAGRVRRASASRMAPAGFMLKPRRTWDGYPEYALSKRGRAWHVKGHRLVALAFLGSKPFPGAHVAHWDGDKWNNAVTNLRWATPAENEADKRRHGRARGARPGEAHHRAKLTVSLVGDLRRAAAGGLALSAIADRFRVPALTAYEAIVGKTWACVTDPPPFVYRRAAA